MDWEVRLLVRPTHPGLVEDEEQAEEVQQILGVDVLEENILEVILVAEVVGALLVVSLFEQRHNFGDQQLILTLRPTATKSG